MTAPNTGGGGAQGLIQTILTIRQLQQQDFNQRLAQEQLDLQKQRAGVDAQQTQSQIAATGEQMLGHLGMLASSLPDPKVLLPHVQDIAQRTGLDPSTIQTIFENATPSTATSQSAAVARGIAGANGAYDAPAASMALTQSLPGGVTGDELHQQIFKGAQKLLSNLPQDQQDLFHMGVLQKLGTGQTLGEALNDQIFASLPKDQQIQAIQIGKGLAPSANEVIQGRLGAGQLALQTNAQATDAAYKTMMGQAALAEAQAKLKGNDLAQATQLIDNITKYQQFLSKNSSTFTPEGLASVNGGYNSLIDQLTKIDPSIAKNFPKLDLTKPVSFPSFIDYLKAQP